MYPEKTAGLLKEGFMTKGDRICAQVSAEHILGVMRRYLERRENSLFFFMELPLDLEEENIERQPAETEPGIIRGSRYKVYFLDDISRETCETFLDLFGEILLHDGLSAFGFGDHSSEVGKYKYNQMMIYDREDITAAKGLLTEAGVPEREHLLFAWDLINEENPGVSERYKDSGGRSVFDIVDALKPIGLYLAEIRNEEEEDTSDEIF